MNLVTRTAIALALSAASLVLIAGTASAASQSIEYHYGTDWNGIHKSKSDFGVDVDFEAGVTARDGSANNYAAPFAVQANADGLAEAKLFGVTVELANIHLGTHSNHNNALSADGYVRVGGVTVWEKGWSSDFEETVADMVIFGVGGEASFGIAGITVTAEAEAGGMLELGVMGELGQGQVTAGLVPGLNVGANVSASVAVGTFRAGVEGDLTLVSVGVPATATLEHNGGGNFTMSFGLDIDWEALSGTIKLFAKEKSTGIKTKKTIFNYDGWGGTINLMTAATSFSI